MEYDATCPWARQPCDEEQEAWEAFRAYLLLPRPRDLDAHALIHGTERASLARWRRENLWDARAKLWDAYGQEAERAIVGDEVRGRSRTTLIDRMKALSMVEMGKRLRVALATDGPVLDDLNVLRYAREAVRLERLEAGKATDRVEGIDLSNLSDDDLATYRELVRKAERG